MFDAILQALAGPTEAINALFKVLEKPVGTIDSFVWGPWLIALLVGGHLFLTFRTGFIQRKLPTAIKLSFAKDPDAEGDISQFGALATALSATIGTGNIVGVATAILSGGPGAVLWMWLIGVVGIATKYSETYVAVKYRVKDHEGKMLGGAMYAWVRGFMKDGKAPLWALVGAGLFAFFAAFASFGIGSAVQASSVTTVITESFPAIPAWAVGAVLVVLVSLVLFGGIKSIARVSEAIVPVMAIVYALGCLVIIGINHAYVGPAIVEIVKSAFTPSAAFGGALGGGLAAALRYGAARGLFSNESGMGSAPIAASAATTRNPARQALVSMTGTFWDTVVICALTGLVLVSTMLAHEPEFSAKLAEGGFAAGGALTSWAFATIPYVGKPILVFGMALFSFSTILGWSYYGNRAVAYLFGRHAVVPYQILYVIVAFLGAVGIAGVVWDMSDIANALMAVPNIIVVLLLSGVIARETKHYVWENNLDEANTDEIPLMENK
ncbi:MAG: sodium:alanine symporter family protein [Eggerthellaceae bacterium]|nr:sodium:alanine symporter family protein [Eggerthellaceae bacterium]